MKTSRMLLVNSILFVLTGALVASTYYYYKEKRLLKEFIRHSRRHRHHQDMDAARLQRANRYLSFSIVLSCIALPLFIENFVEAFIEENWKWLLPSICLAVFLRLYKNYTVNRNNRLTRSLAVSFENNDSQQ
jgi:hypothetical protein